VKNNRRQRRSGAGQGVTEELVDPMGEEAEEARPDTDGDFDPDALDALGLDTDGLDSDLDGDAAPPSRRGRRGTGTLVETETEAEAPLARHRPTVGGAPGTGRTTPRQFLHEVNVEMRKVAWPTRKETINYSSVVFVTLTALMALIFGLDYAFNHLAIYLFK
jgi:preprotein translocase subunit SecE